MKKRVKIKVILILIITFIWVVFIYIACKQARNERIFTTEKWIEAPTTKRYLMIDDLEENYELIGMSNAEIEELLGGCCVVYDPNRETNDSDYYWGYTIREDFWEGDEVLLIHFKDNKVVKVEKEYLSYL